MSASIAVQSTNLDGLVNLAEGCVQAVIDSFFGRLARLTAIAFTSTEAPLHQGAKRRHIAAVVQAVALSNLDALTSRLVIRHRSFGAADRQTKILTPQPSLEVA